MIPEECGIFNMIKKAVFPIAGLGTRFLPATKASPKEMLPIVDKPLIQYAVEEAYDAGVRQMVFITGRSKRAVEDHFDLAYELEAELECAQKCELLSVVRSVTPEDMQCIFIRQSKALGLGHAILCAESAIGNDPFAILLADDLIIDNNGLKELMQIFEEEQASVVALQNIDINESNRYGIVVGQVKKENLLKVRSIIEKPEPKDSPSTLAVVGRYILQPTIFQYLKQQPLDSRGEIQLTDAIAAMLMYEDVYAYQFEGTRYDCGSKLGFLQATYELGKRHKEVGLEFSTWLECFATR